MQEYVDNILAVYHDAPSWTQEAGAAWYRVESERCADFGNRFGLTRKQVAAAAAAISPGLRWDTTFAHLDVLMRDRKHPVPTYSREFVRRALVCLGRNKPAADEDANDPLTVLGGPKVRAFYGLLSQTDMEGVVIDGHAWNICRAKREVFRSRPEFIVPDSARVTPARYAIAEACYREAARVLDLPAYAVQAATWIHWRTPNTGVLRLDF